jgi:hypothetical protein
MMAYFSPINTNARIIDLYILNFSVLEIRWNIRNYKTEQQKSADFILLISV